MSCRSFVFLTEVESWSSSLQDQLKSTFGEADNVCSAVCSDEKQRGQSTAVETFERNMSRDIWNIFKERKVFETDPSCDFKIGGSSDDDNDDYDRDQHQDEWLWEIQICTRYPKWILFETNGMNDENFGKGTERQALYKLRRCTEEWVLWCFCKAWWASGCKILQALSLIMFSFRPSLTRSTVEALLEEGYELFYGGGYHDSASI